MKSWYLAKIIAPLIFILLPSLVANGQVGEARHTLSVGINGGVGINRIMFDPTIKQANHIGPNYGVTLRMTSEKYFSMLCALQVELNYAQLGWTEDIMDSNNEPLPDTYRRNINYVQLPFMARLGWGKEKSGLMGYFLAGPQVGYCFSEKSKRSTTWTTNTEGNPDRPNNMYMQYNMPVVHKFDYGITAGLGVELNTSTGHFMIDCRYYYGLGDIYGNSKKDVFSRSNNGTVIVKFSYLFDLKK